MGVILFPLAYPEIAFKIYLIVFEHFNHLIFALGKYDSVLFEMRGLKDNDARLRPGQDLIPTRFDKRHLAIKPVIPLVGFQKIVNHSHLKFFRDALLDFPIAGFEGRDIPQGQIWIKFDFDTHIN